MTDGPIIPLVPREMVVAPFFAAVKQSEPRELIIDGKRWVIGIDHPTKRRRSPALDMRHAKACFSLLSFRDRLQNGRDIYFSMNEFCKRYASSQGGRYARDILNILYDLQETYVARELGDGNIEYFQILGEIKIHQKAARRKDALQAVSMQKEMWLDRVTMSPEFFGLLRRWEELARIRLDVLTSLKSVKAQAIYAYIPSRAAHHTKEDPFSIKVSNVLRQIGAPVPEHKSVRKKIMTQHGDSSILGQLDRSETVDGLLRVEMVETLDKTDFKLNFWLEREKAEPPPLENINDSNGKMLQAWIKSGRSQQTFYERIKKSQPLDDYHKELLEKAEVDLGKTEKFFEMAASVLGTAYFDQLVSEAKGDALEGNQGTNPTGRMIYRILKAMEQG